jgi:hypothetical protein
MTPKELEIIRTRVSEKTEKVFDKDIKAFEQVQLIMNSSNTLEEYYIKFETYLDSILLKH